MHDDLRKLAYFAWRNRVDLLGQLDFNAKKRIYNHYSEFAGGAQVEDSNADLRFDVQCEKLQKQHKDSMIYYEPESGMGRGFHKFQSILRKNLKAQKRIYIHCSTPEAAARLCAFFAFLIGIAGTGIVVFKCSRPSKMHTRSETIVVYLEGVGGDKTYVNKVLDKLGEYYRRSPNDFADGLPKCVKQVSLDKHPKDVVPVSTPISLDKQPKDGVAVSTPMKGVGWTDEPEAGGLVDGENDSKEQSFGTFYAGLTLQALKDAFEEALGDAFDYSASKICNSPAAKKKQTAIDNLQVMDICCALVYNLKRRGINPNKPHIIQPRDLQAQNAITLRHIRRPVRVRPRIRNDTNIVQLPVADTAPLQAQVHPGQVNLFDPRRQLSQGVVIDPFQPMGQPPHVQRHGHFERVQRRNLNGTNG